MAKYPGAIPSLAEIFTAIDYVDWTNTAKWNNLRAELRAALVELGTLPKGGFADVKARLNDIYPQFHDRGDPSVWDFVLGDLTTDATWRDLNLSGVVPAGAKAVLLRIDLLDDAVGSILRVRKNGNSFVYVVAGGRTQVANIVFTLELVVACDSDRVIEYYTTNVVWSSINIAIKGWWK